jgi:hypothetical protein
MRHGYYYFFKSRQAIGSDEAQTITLYDKRNKNIPSMPC